MEKSTQRPSCGRHIMDSEESVITQTKISEPFDTSSLDEKWNSDYSQRPNVSSGIGRFMPDHNFIKKIACPWCGRGETLGTAETQGIISLVCQKCGRYYIADFNNCKSMKSNAVRKAAANSKI